ncbi:hypothetical protein B7463_g10638, partial [Scytalidium lignicola]
MLMRAADHQDYKGDAQLSQCPDGTWCCGYDATNNCCESTNTFALAATLGATTSTTSSTPPPSSTASTSTSPSQSSTSSISPSASSHSHGLSTGARAGVGTGVALGGLALLVILGVAIVWFRKRRARGAGQATQHDSDVGFMRSMDSDDLQTPAVEMSVSNNLAEISTTDIVGKKPVRHELA